MSDFGRDRLMDTSEDRLPWLEEAEANDEGDGTPIGTLIAAVIAGLVAIGLVVGGVFWLRNRGADEGTGAVIAPPAAAYKEKPAEPGGMKVEGTGDVAYRASEGAAVNSTIDLDALPEAPVTAAPAKPAAPAQVATKPVATKPVAAVTAPVVAAKPVPPAPVAPVAKPAPKPVVVAAAAKPVAKPVAAAKPAPVPAATATATGGGAQVQLGAFSSEAAANKAWKSLSGRFGFLAALPHSVTAAPSGGTTLYRLRVSAGGEAQSICGKLKVAGEACTVIR
jgi:cell division septation protein DedD